MTRREKAILILGNKCVRCGNTDIRVLDIDHVIEYSDDPSIPKNYELYQLIIDNLIDLSRVQILCANCHRLKSREIKKKYNQKTTKEIKIAAVFKYNKRLINEFNKLKFKKKIDKRFNNEKEKENKIDKIKIFKELRSLNIPENIVISMIDTIK